MTRTVADVLTSARQTMNDAAGRNTSTAELEGFVLDGVNTARNERPEIFLGNWGEITGLTGTVALPMDARFFRPLVDYVIARAEMKDAEHVESGRAEMMLKLAVGGLT